MEKTADAVQLSDDDPIRRDYDLKKAWGILASIDLHGCNPKTIRDADRIKQFVYELCELIDMKRFGECNVVYFGQGDIAGYSMTQLIETSLISAHFDETKSSVTYLDVFSCKYFNPTVVAEFGKKFFEAKDYNLNYILRK